MIEDRRPVGMNPIAWFVCFQIFQKPKLNYIPLKLIKINRIRWNAHRFARSRWQQLGWKYTANGNGFRWFSTATSAASYATSTTIQLSSSGHKLSPQCCATIQLQYSTVSKIGSGKKGFKHAIFIGMLISGTHFEIVLNTFCQSIFDVCMNPNFRFWMSVSIFFCGCLYFLFSFFFSYWNVLSLILIRRRKIPIILRHTQLSIRMTMSK